MISMRSVSQQLASLLKDMKFPAAALCLVLGATLAATLFLQMIVQLSGGESWIW